MLVMLLFGNLEMFRFILVSMNRLIQQTYSLKSGWNCTRDLNVAEGADTL